MPKIAGHSVSAKQLVALHGLYRGLVKNQSVYGVNVRRHLDMLANRGVIRRTGMNMFMIPYGSPGADIIAATPDFVISAHL